MDGMKAAQSPRDRPHRTRAPQGRVRRQIHRSHEPDYPRKSNLPGILEARTQRQRIASDLAARVRAEMRAWHITQDELSRQIGISQPQLANALAGRFGIGVNPAARLRAWLQIA